MVTIPVAVVATIVVQTALDYLTETITVQVATGLYGFFYFPASVAETILTDTVTTAVVNKPKQADKISLSALHEERGKIRWMIRI